MSALFRVFEIPQIPFAFEFESEQPNGNSVTKQLPYYHSSDLDKVGQTTKRLIDQTFLKGPNGNSVTVLLLTCHSAVQTQTETQTDTELQYLVTSSAILYLSLYGSTDACIQGCCPWKRYLLGFTEIIYNDKKIHFRMSVEFNGLWQKGVNKCSFYLLECLRLH